MSLPCAHPSENSGKSDKPDLSPDDPEAARTGGHLRVRRLHPCFGAEMAFPDLSKASGAVSSEIQQVLNNAGLVLIRNVKLDEEGLLRFARQFGPLQNLTNVSGRMVGAFRVTNLGEDGKLRDADDPARKRHEANKLWHTDSSFISPGATYSFLLAHIVPAADKDTLFCDGRVAWDVLEPERQRQLSPLIAYHSINHSLMLAGAEIADYAGIVPIARKLVRHHKPSGRNALVVPSHVEHIDGLDDAESFALIEELIGITAAPERVYRHKWRPGDLLIWDNRCMLHRASRKNGEERPRELYTCRIVDVDDDGLAPWGR